MPDISRREVSGNLAKLIGALTVGGATTAVTPATAAPANVIDASHPLFAAIADWKEKLEAKRLASEAFSTNRHLNYVDFDTNPFRVAFLEADAVELEAWQTLRSLLLEL